MKNKGITLIALIITIIILLILASISINMISGNNSLIKNAGKAKESSEISEEKQIVDISTTQAMGKNKYGDLIQEQLQEELDINTGDKKASVTEDDGNLIIQFVDSGRYYKVNNNGDVSEFNLYVDTTPGELAGTGTEEDPFKIECIEDLVAFSIQNNGGNTSLGLSAHYYEGEYVSLVRTLDFNSIFSYNDYTTTIYGDLNNDGNVEDIKTELTKKNEGCTGFLGIGNEDKYFKGIFDGENFKIKNIYIKKEQSAGLFVKVDGSSIIKNIGVTGYIESTSKIAAGICAYTLRNAKFMNAYNEAEIVGNTSAGGIAAYHYTGTKTYINCYNSKESKTFY